MTNKLKVSCQYTRKNNSEPCWYISDGGDKYMREDGTIHRHMTHDGGTYFATKEKAERVMRNRTDEPAAPKTWAQMTDAEKGALLLARHEGKVIEVFEQDDPSLTKIIAEPCWQNELCYRVRPPEPVRETVTLHGRLYVTKIYPDGIWDFDRNPAQSDDTHRITFDTIDGEPDCESIRMERINDQP